MSNRISGFLIVTLLTIVVIIAIEVRGGIPSADDVGVSSHENDENVAASPIRYSLPPLESLSETISRPLFLDSRRPPEEETETATESATAVTPGRTVSFSVSAIVITENERAVLLTHSQSRELTRVAEGESVAGWRLEKVEKERAIFSKDGETQEVHLRSFDSATPRRSAPLRPGGRPPRVLNPQNAQRAPEATPSRPQQPSTER